MIYRMEECVHPMGVIHLFSDKNIFKIKWTYLWASLFSCDDICFHIILVIIHNAKSQKPSQKFHS